jgi:phage shock protein A
MGIRPVGTNRNNWKNYCLVVLGVLTLFESIELPMSELVEIVDSLENKISKLLHKVELLNQAKGRLEEELIQIKQDHEATKKSVQEWEEKYETLKLANSMLGSETNKTEAKLKINTLIRELDHCISQLAE